MSANSSVYSIFMGAHSLLLSQPAPETIPIHWVCTHLTIALRQERGWKSKGTGSSRWNHSRENNKEIKRWVNLPAPSFLSRSGMVIRYMRGRQSEYMASNALSIFLHGAGGKQLFMRLSEGGNKYSVLLGNNDQKDGEWMLGWLRKGTMWSISNSLVFHFQPLEATLHFLQP